MLIAKRTVMDGGLGFRDHNSAAIGAFMVPLLRSIQCATHGVPLTDDCHIRLNSIHARSLAAWHTSSNPSRMIASFRLHLTRFLHTCSFLGDPQEGTIHLTPAHFLQQLHPKGLQAQLYRHGATNNFLRSLETLSEPIQRIMPSLLTPLTSIPMHSLPRRFTDNRFTPPLYLLALKRKLRLPLFTPQPPPSCTHCRRTMDDFGDHYFSCRYSKTPMHNQLRDALYIICKQLAPYNPHHVADDVVIEPTNLLPEYPMRRPADLAIRLATPTVSDSQILAVDITFTPVPSGLTNRCATRAPPNSPTNIHEAHQRSIRTKFNGRTYAGIPNATIIEALNRQRITLVPFTIDLFGGIVFFAHHFLYGAHPPFPKPPPPPWLLDHPFAHQPAHAAFCNTIRTPLAVIHTAHRTWHMHPARSHPFGTTHYTSTPTQWATQLLALNITHGLARHLHRAHSVHSRPYTHDPLNALAGQPPPARHRSTHLRVPGLPSHSRPPAHPWPS